jgi:hypothetical protein
MCRRRYGEASPPAPQLISSEAEFYLCSGHAVLVATIEKARIQTVHDPVREFSSCISAEAEEKKPGSSVANE